MKKERRTIKVNHPEVGELIKTVEYTYDETKYSTLEEAIEDGDKCQIEFDVYINNLIKENQEEKARIDNENKEAFDNWMKSKPIEIVFESKKPDNTPFANRGIINKEHVSTDLNPTEGAAIQALKNATPEEIEQIKTFLGLK